MAVLISEFYDLVLDRRAVSRSDAGNLTRIERRLVQIIAYRLMQTIRSVPNMTLYLRLLYFVGREREGHRFVVRGLRGEGIPIYRPAVKSRRRARLKASDRKTEPLETFRKFDRGRLTGPAR